MTSDKDNTVNTDISNTEEGEIFMEIRFCRFVVQNVFEKDFIAFWSDR